MRAATCTVSEWSSSRSWAAISTPRSGPCCGEQVTATRIGRGSRAASSTMPGRGRTSNRARSSSGATSVIPPHWFPLVGGYTPPVGEGSTGPTRGFYAGDGRWQSISSRRRGPSSRPMCMRGGTPIIIGMTAIKASLLILVAFAAVPPQSAGAVELFVSPAGRDSWPGTKSRPFATLERARRAVRGQTAGMRPSDIVVNLRGGTYRLRRPFRLSAAAGDSGENGRTVIYQAYGYGTGARERVVISGGRRVSG